jgi:hypothetical protein
MVSETKDMLRVTVGHFTDIRPNIVMPFVVFCCILALGAGTSLLLKTYWKRVNDNRDMGVYEVNITDMDSEHIDRLGDRHPSFRYLL